MYRTSPLTYLLSGMLSTGLANIDVQCDDIEIILVQPPANQTCGDYLAAYMQLAGGAVYNPEATSNCEFCEISESNVFLESVSAYYSDRWRNFGLMWVYIAFNIATTLFLYWFVRVRGGSSLARLRRGVSTVWNGVSRKPTNE